MTKQSSYFLLAALLVLSTNAANADAKSLQTSVAVGNAPPVAAAASQGAAPVPDKNPAYQSALRNLLPMSPPQIRDFKKAVLQNQQALRGGPSPEANTQTLRVTVGPGSEIPVVQISPRYGVALTVLDATGKPWPITSATVGSQKAFSVTKPVEKGPGSSLLTIVPLLPFAHSNIILTLKSLATPILVRLETTPDENDGRTDLVVAARGPNAVAPVTSRSLDSPDNEVMRYLLDGVPPANARRVEIKGGPARGWIIGGQFYLRTPLSILSPAWIAAVHGAGGIGVYQMPIVPAVMATDTDGVTVSLRLGEGALIDGALAQGSTTMGMLQYGPSISASQD